ncbi:hypothetical protein DY120_00665 [Apilactobacillus micheneri]|uniref:WxL domain-containing protein n=1 Tax=Apilactobacillus micheneri TaxID=1899430 RepID=A0ABY2YZD8_9LACO|nr:hypothetical protein [Apilactobacillus micheneri]TPR26242.1 hypothetical protein DY114_00665 [Apilactobacillus micheneri]TPR26996.1 hypothetical protein DY111_00665 [Apilactobacillus micheneri]TPR27854.1 hypothetical protein DY113_04440 [Apilactobacillus micheneri]TPR31759.1 hypothetical protein DY117_00665 [Apilactobacillus micheneri]TPR32163.1 hypothetical protein DY120_00665 [Apilactobacillus micheneri]
MLKKRKIVSCGVLFSTLLGLGLSTSNVMAHADSHSTNGSVPDTSVYNNGSPIDPSNSKNSSTDYAKKTSKATVKVVNGYLVLEAVPDFDFGIQTDNSSAMRANLFGNGASNGQIAVSDSRNGNNNNWTLNASLGKFTSPDAGYTDNKANASDWTLNLNNTNSKNNQNNIIQTNPVSLKGSDDGNSNAKTVMQSSPGKNKGETTLDYASNSSQATLDMPGNLKVGTYNAPVYWSLGAGSTPDPTPGTPTDTSKAQQTSGQQTPGQ